VLPVLDGAGQLVSGDACTSSRCPPRERQVAEGKPTTVNAFLLGVVAGFGIAVPVGAIAVLIVQVGVRCGFRCAASAGAGAASADLLYAVLAVTGGAALATAVSGWQEALRWTSAAVLITIALLGLWRARLPVEQLDEPLPGAREYALTYARFLGLTVINPLTVVYFAAIVVGLDVAAGLTAVDAVAFVIGAFLASLSWQTLLAAVGAVAGRRLPAHFATVAAIGGNLVVLGLAALILLR
jgi:threonine/homoserine/homoserine lactone efflux protein